MLTNVPALLSLIVREHEVVADILKLPFRIFGDLRELKLQECLHGEDSSFLLANILTLFPDLEVLPSTYIHCLPSHPIPEETL